MFPPSSEFWQHKPWWCQPWSILLTGFTGIGASSWCHLRFQLPLWIVVPFVMGILAWWLLFLVIVPADYKRAP